uniref:Uncharacterized protein n=1 Tax=Gadus morhua TaxID=8049 RepID=A0A8C5CNM1_GADMO
MSASETPKSRLETSSLPPVSTPAPALPLKPLLNMSCCHFPRLVWGERVLASNRTRDQLLPAKARPMVPFPPPPVFTCKLSLRTNENYNTKNKKGK